MFVYAIAINELRDLKYSSNINIYFVLEAIFQLGVTLTLYKKQLAFPQKFLTRVNEGVLKMEIPQDMQAAYQKALKKTIGIEYFKKLMEPSDFLDKVSKLTHEAAVAAGLIKGSPIVVSDLVGQRKSISVFIMHISRVPPPKSITM